MTTPIIDLDTIHLDHGAHADPDEGHCLIHNGRAVVVSPAAVERFATHVLLTESGCHEWTGPTMHRGYGLFHVAGLAVRAHRFAFQVARGLIADGMVLDHLCRNRRCVNPEHLEAVTPGENVHRSPIAPARLNAAKTHCPKGHPYSGDNVRYRPSGARRCAECYRIANRNRTTKASV